MLSLQLDSKSGRQQQQQHQQQHKPPLLRRIRQQLQHVSPELVAIALGERKSVGAGNEIEDKGEQATRTGAAAC
jgi:hypothetical protein